VGCGLQSEVCESEVCKRFVHKRATLLESIYSSIWVSELNLESWAFLSVRGPTEFEHKRSQSVPIGENLAVVRIA
jgi:hypothetical protein